MPRIFDTFLFRDELDMLECRLHELEDHDITHVLVEATVTHSGIPKPLWYADNRDRFSAWDDRIIHVVVDDMPDGDDNWKRERYQREQVWKGLTDADPDDIIIASDCDEILTSNAIVVAENLSGDLGWRLDLRKFIYCCDWEVFGGQQWNRAVVTRCKHIGNETRSFDELQREARFDTAPDSWGQMGWHFSFFGGKEAVLAKLESDCHPEMREKHRKFLDEGLCIEKGQFPWAPDRARPVDVNETWPRWVREGKAPASWFRPR